MSTMVSIEKLSKFSKWLRSLEAEYSNYILSPICKNYSEVKTIHKPAGILASKISFHISPYYGDIYFIFWNIFYTIFCYYFYYTNNTNEFNDLYPYTDEEKISIYRRLPFINLRKRFNTYLKKFKKYEIISITVDDVEKAFKEL